MASKEFKDTQQKWMGSFLSNANGLCDTIFIIGPEKIKMHGVRALLANISPVFRAQLFGNFKESQKNEEIEFPTLSPIVFECILRCSLGLNPKICERSAVSLLSASQMLQIEALQKECHHYLQHCIHEKNVLFLLNSAYCLNSLDADLCAKCKKIIFGASVDSILQNEGFYSLHPDLLIEIISSNELEAKEEFIWESVIKWAQNVMAKKLKFVSDDAKENEFGMHSILKPIIPHIRYTLMEKAFFVESVCKYLSRKQAESVFVHFLLNKATIFNEQPRKKSHFAFNVVSASKELESAQKLSNLSVDALFCSQTIRDSMDWQWFVVDLQFVGSIKAVQIKNKYADKDTLKRFKLQMSAKQNDFDEEAVSGWVDVEQFESAKSSEWQSFDVNTSKKSRYWRIVLMDTYGGYTCLNHLKIKT